MKRNVQPKAESPDTDTGSTATQDVASDSRRALLRAAWIPPVIVALNLPRSGYAANISASSKPGKDQHGNPYNANGNNGNAWGKYK